MTMAAPDTNDRTVLRATSGSYCSLVGIWVVLAAGYVLLTLKQPGKDLEWGAAIPGVVGLLFMVWLRGFRIILTKDSFEYRDGFYRIWVVPIKDVVDVKHEWRVWRNLGKRLKVPRITVVTKSQGNHIRINPQPFGELVVRTLRQRLPEN
jgi:hypothetical protein